MSSPEAGELPLLDASLAGAVDLTDPALHVEYDLSAVWRELRDNEPVYWHRATERGEGFWVVTRHADVTAVYRDCDTFSSQRGNVLDRLQHDGDPAGGQMMAVTDGQRHNALRTVLSKPFSPRALADVVDTVRAAARRLVREAVTRGECDFVADVAARIPLAAICGLLGIPGSDQARILTATSSALASASGTPTEEQTWQAKNDILHYFSRLVSARRAAPDDDVISLLTACEAGGKKLRHSEVVLNCYSILLGGNETTRYSMAGGLLALIRNPRQWDALRSGEVGVRGAVEEILRWTTPTLHAGRTAVTPAVIGGRQIAAGDIVTIWNASANRDERKFDQPGLFDLRRDPNKHVTFAYGAHFCIGAYLARAEIAALLDALRTMVSKIELEGQPTRVYSNFLSGLSSMPVRLIG